MRNYKLISDHPEDLTGGRVLVPGEVAAVDDEDSHNKRLVDEGKLVPMPDVEAQDKPAQSSQPTTDGKGDS